jgi:hypothetical protein
MLSIRRSLLLVVLVAVVTTFIHYIDFGSRDQISELPIVMRAMEPDFLPHDFYTNAASPYGPRYFYARFLALLTDRTWLPFWAFLLTLLINIAIAAVTFLLARHLFDGSHLAGLLAVAMVMGITTFKLGYFHYLHARQLLSNTLVLPFIFFSLWAAIKKRPYCWALLAGPAVLIHPTFGAEAGLIGFGLMVSVDLFGQKKRVTDFLKKNLARYGPPLLLFLAAAAVPLMPYLSQPHLDTPTFIEIETRFRHGHHNLLGHLPGFDQGLYFFIAAGIAWYFWQSKRPQYRDLARALRLAALFLLALCLLGLVFVHLFPCRLFALARPFRLLFLVKWLGLILIAGHTADILKNRGTVKIRPAGLALLVSVLSPLTLGLTHLAHLMRHKIGRAVKIVEALVSPLFVLAAVSAYLIVVWQPQAKYLLPYCSFCLLVWMVYRYRQWWPVCLISVVLVGLLLLPIVRYSPLHSRLPTAVGDLLAGVVPRLTLADLSGGEVEMARLAHSFTPKDSLFLVPPEFGIFRLMAERAVVVDWKSFPFQDAGMKEWYRRLEECYGPIDYIDYKGKRQIMKNYRHIGDEKILSLHRRYGFHYAVLHRDTPTRLPVLFQTAQFKVVAAADSP